MAVTEKHPLVLDIGTYATRAGFGGDSEPIHVIPTIIGRIPRNPNNSQYLQASNSQNIFIGENAYKSATQLVLSNPMENRIIKNLDDTQILLDFVFSSKLKISINKVPLVLAISPFSTEKDRENLATLIFETFRVPLYYCGLSSSLILYASGYTTGIAIDAGETDINIVPVYESFSMMNLAKKLDIGGKNFSDIIKKSFITSGNSIPLSNERNILQDIKEHSCYIQDIKDSTQNQKHDDDDEEEENENQSYKIPTELCELPKAIFEPRLLSVESPGLGQLTLQTMESIDNDIKDVVQKNIVLSGGTSLIRGFPQQLEKEVLEKHDSINIVSSASRKIAPWVGGSMIASIGTFKDLAISKEEYEEVGPTVVHFKCY